jgi:hypothetical protein
MSSDALAAVPLLYFEPLFAPEAMGFTSSCRCGGSLPADMCVSGGTQLIF